MMIAASTFKKSSILFVDLNHLNGSFRLLNI